MKLADYERYLQMSRRNLLKGGGALGAMAAAGALGFGSMPAFADAAPLSAVALDDAMDRLYALGKPVPTRSAAVFSQREGDPVDLRLAQGDAFNDYIGTSMELKAPGREPWHAWLLLVESLPAGTEGSPVARNLVRNVFRPDWGNVMGRAPGLLAEDRAMQIHAGARADRLRLVAVLQDARGHIRAISRTACSE